MLPCPHCGAPMAPPSSKRKCPACGELVLFRTDPETKAKVLVTEQGAKDLVQKGKDLRLINFAAHRLGWIGVTKDAVLRERDELTRSGERLTISEAIWRIADRYVTDLRASGHPVSSMLYVDMAHVADYEGKSNAGFWMEYHAALEVELEEQHKQDCERLGYEYDPNWKDV